ncbi:MAG: flagellar biosynthesis protein FlgA [Verrucomicrobiota bacterium]|jgi:flagellar P-ring protein precursor FlgI
MRFFLLLISFLLPFAAQAARVKDLVRVEGERDNQLVGYGLVVGLAGDGDSNALATLQSIANILERNGVKVDPALIKSKNAAAVMITADIGAFLPPGTRIDVTVAALGDAKSLQGGVLLQSPLLGADGRVYAVAQGPIAVGGFVGGAGGAGGATVQKNHPTVGIISNGAIVEREIPASVVRGGRVVLTLRQPDFTSASRLAEAIAEVLPETAARARDAANVDLVLPPAYQGHEIRFLADVGAIAVTPDSAARVVINERTGTIVATAPVGLSQVAISHGSLTITIAQNLEASQPAPFSRGGQTAILPSTETNVTETKGSFILVPEASSVERLATALNALGVTTREMMAIFQTLKSAGALQADLVIN